MIFGTGTLGIRSASILKDELPLIAFCDNSPMKQGQEVEGLPCISPMQLAEYQNPFVLISTSRYYYEIHQQLEQLQIPHCSLDAYVVYRHFEEVKNAYEALEEASRETYAAVLLYRMTGEKKLIKACCTGHQYFCFPEFWNFEGTQEVFVDCGAYVGDTLEKYIENVQGFFKRIYAFEPVPRTFAAMQRRVAFLKEIWALSDEQIVCEQCGVGRRMQKSRLSSSSAHPLVASLTAGGGQDGSEEIPIVSLDAYLMQHHAEPISFLKADIEGAEWDMLHGAAQTIRSCRPRLAISVYHSIFDLFRIQNYLRELVPEYRFRLCHHSTHDSETVLYCCT